jgi:hypothetical protein
MGRRGTRFLTRVDDTAVPHVKPEHLLEAMQHMEECVKLLESQCVLESRFVRRACVASPLPYPLTPPCDVCHA